MPGFDSELFLSLLARRCGRVDRETVALCTVDSTSSELRRRIATGNAEGTVVVADTQLEGRGRLGRSWQSNIAGNLYLSVAIPLRAPLSDSVPRLPLVAGLAAADALIELAPSLGERLRLKWPNDVLVSGKKLGGILCELLPQRSMAIVGLGLNLRPASFDEQHAPTATSMTDHLEAPLGVEEVAAAFVAGLEAQLAFFCAKPMEALVARWTAWAEPPGRRVRVGEVEGFTAGLDSEGRLRVQTDQGELVSISGGVVEAVSF
ncbi:MAG: biotin--[acetyl-CoA-carboxylase] ligase [Myxococcota bacterium]|jgi:BirA family biotin operon repressor/biotin-[acetyl-CoA-carboxylase] ligase|nr:biotin--[acetyl-CoA-carboxylase] ligase [Myxococcota bacterium]